MKYLTLRSLAIIVSLLLNLAQCRPLDARSLVSAVGRRTFGDSMKEGIIKPRTNTTLFNYSSSTGGCLTYLWWTMSSLKYKPVDGWEDTRIRVYVDDEVEASISFALYLGIGVGFHDQTGSWGGHRSGKLGRNMGGVYLTYRIPFSKTVRVEAETIVTESMIYWTTVRGITGAMPVIVGDFVLPASTRLRLQKHENRLV